MILPLLQPLVVWYLIFHQNAQSHPLNIQLVQITCTCMRNSKAWKHDSPWSGGQVNEGSAQNGLHVDFDHLLLLSPTQHQYHKITSTEHCKNTSLIKNCNKSFQAGYLQTQNPCAEEAFYGALQVQPSRRLSHCQDYFEHVICMLRRSSK